MTSTELPVIAAVDGSTHGRDALDRAAREALDFAFETAASRRGARLRIVHGWTMFSSMLSGGPRFDRAAAADAAERTRAGQTAGRREAYPQVEVVQEPVNGSASHTLVTASATAALTVIGRRRRGESLGLGLSPVAQTTLTHARGWPWYPADAVLPRPAVPSTATRPSRSRAAAHARHLAPDARGHRLTR